MTNNILIIKHGALGDVVRTSYFPKSLKSLDSNQNIFWLTSISALDLIRYNPYIDKIVFEIQEIQNIHFDVIYSLDDEIEILEQLNKLRYNKIIGARIENDEITYCEESSYWFDMGLVSKLGKDKADHLKKENKLTHKEIFEKIFDVEEVTPLFYNSEFLKENILEKYHIPDNCRLIGVNPYAGKRWAAKELRTEELYLLLNELITKAEKHNLCILLFGEGEDYNRNVDLKHSLNVDNSLILINTNYRLLDFAAIISNLDLLISSDSLALHLGISNSIETICFFSPTSASEIEDKNVHKILSNHIDYCNYRKDSDNSTITHDRIIRVLLKTNIFDG